MKIIKLFLITVIVALPSCARDSAIREEHNSFATSMRRQEEELQKKIQNDVANLEKDIVEDRERSYPTKAWTHECKVDQFTDKKSCLMEKFFYDPKYRTSAFDYRNRIQVEIDQFSQLKLAFGGQSHPLDIGKVRIGKNQVEYFKGSRITGEQAKHILKQMANEEHGLVEVYLWPGESSRFEFDLSDINTAYAELEKEYFGEPGGIYRYVAPDGRIYYSDKPKNSNYKLVIYRGALK